MTKCVYNGLTLGHNLVKGKKRPKSSSVTGMKSGDVTPKDKSSIAKLLCLSTLLECIECKDRIENIFDTNEKIYLKDKIKTSCRSTPF